MTRTITALAALAAALALAGCSTQANISTAQRHQLIYDEGGNIYQRIEDINRRIDNRTEVRLNGLFCGSSCTMELVSPYTCVGPGTPFVWHRPATHAFERWAGVRHAEGEALWLIYTPKELRGFVMNAFEKGGFATLSGQEIHKRAGVPLCD